LALQFAVGAPIAAGSALGQINQVVWHFDFVGGDTPVIGGVHFGYHS
jgi:hypothetical protein